MSIDIKSMLIGRTQGKKGGGPSSDSIVIDVESLPTENVDESKIYRTTKETEPSAEIYAVWKSSPVMTLSELFPTLEGFPQVDNFIIHVIDSPADFNPDTIIPYGASGLDLHVYVDTESGAAYVDTGTGSGVQDLMLDVIQFYPEENCGVISNPNDLAGNECAYGYLRTGGETHTIYGIPDKKNTKTTFEYTADGKWVERGGIIDVAKLPTQNIKDGAAYRLSTESNMYVYESWSGKRYTLQEARPGAVLHIVEELPEQMIPGDYNDGGAWHVYVVESTGIGYYSTTGDPSTDLRTLSWCMLFPEWLGQDMGCIDSLDEITIDGFYFIAGKDNSSMHTHSAEGWTDYINGETHNNILQERNTFSNDRAMLTAKYNATIGHVTDEGALNFLNKIECEVNQGIVTVTRLTDKNIASIIIPTGVSRIKTTVFEDCASLTSLVLSEGLVEIFAGAFRRCTSLTSVIFPSTLETLANGVFEDCSAMQYYDFTALKHVPYISSNGTFWNIPATCQIRVPDDLYEQWMERYGWWSYSNQIVKASEAT